MFFLNEDVASLSFADRLLYIGLWTQADKAGRLEDRPLRLKAALFPYDDFDVEAGLGRLVHANLIQRYEGNSQRLVCIPTWDKHQKPHATEAESVLPSPVVGKNGCLPVIETQEGKGSRITDQGMEFLRERFERFWLAFPRKVGKDAAWAEWKRRNPDEALVSTMLAVVAEQSRSRQWRDPQFIPHPRTWLSQGRWKDAEAPATASIATRTWQIEDCPHAPPCGTQGRCELATALAAARAEKRA